MDVTEYHDFDNIRWDETLSIHERTVVAVEHPLIVKNLDKGIKTFGLGQPFDRILDEKDPKGCIPLYIRPFDPLCPPLLSHNTQTRNVLLKITVPKRTGRKRKRGSNGPFLGECEPSEMEDPVPPRSRALAATGMEDNCNTPHTKRIKSQKRLDNPKEILRSLQDNVDDYTMEAVGDIPYTHRYRGLANFQHSTSNTEFMPKFQELVCSGEVNKIRQFKLGEKRGWKDNGTFFPPPVYTKEALPHNWTGLTNDPKITYSGSRPSSKSHQINYVPWNIENVPTGTDLEPPDDEDVVLCIAKVREAFERRPMWTRRALLSYIRSPLPKYYFDIAVGYHCYQFKSGPFREAIVKYGLDPRTDPKYHIYQTIFFADRQNKTRWADPRGSMEEMKGKYANSYIFDGKTIIPDGSVYMICDITDPLITPMMDRTPLREVYDGQAQGDGWIANGVMAKTKAIMKAKILAIQNKRKFTDEDFKTTLEFPDVHEKNEKVSRSIGFLVPDIAPTEEEKRKLGTVEKSVPLVDLSNDARRRRMRIAEREEGVMPPKEPKIRRQRVPKKTTPRKNTSAGQPTGSATPRDKTTPVNKTPLDGTPSKHRFPEFRKFLDQQEQLEIGLDEEELDGPAYEDEDSWDDQLNEGEIPPFTLGSQAQENNTQPKPPPEPQHPQPNGKSNTTTAPRNKSPWPASKPVQRPTSRAGQPQFQVDEGDEGDESFGSDSTDIVDFKSVPLKKLPGPVVF